MDTGRPPDYALADVDFVALLQGQDAQSLFFDVDGLYDLVCAGGAFVIQLGALAPDRKFDHAKKTAQT